MPAKLTPYRKLLTMAKESIDAALAGVRATKARRQAELEMATLDEQIATLQCRIDETCSNKDGINFKSLIDLLDEVAIAERRKKQYADIINQLFPD